MAAGAASKVPQPFEFEMSVDWVTNTFVRIWQPMLLGSLLLAASAALIAYIGLDLLWRTSVGNYKTRKRNDRARNRSDDRTPLP